MSFFDKNSACIPCKSYLFSSSSILPKFCTIFWALIAHTLGNECPTCGHRLPKACSPTAHPMVCESDKPHTTCIHDHLLDFPSHIQCLWIVDGKWTNAVFNDVVVYAFTQAFTPRSQPFTVRSFWFRKKEWKRLPDNHRMSCRTTMHSHVVQL